LNSPYSNPKFSTKQQEQQAAVAQAFFSGDQRCSPYIDPEVPRELALD
jgi:hypothetical protein